MFRNWFVSNPRLLILTLAVIAVAGVTSYQALPRMEDPILTARYAMITTLFPGATPDRVETIVSKNIELQLSDVKEIRELTSINRNGVSLVIIELNEELKRDQVATSWGVIRERIASAHNSMPSIVSPPRLRELDAKANSLLIALRWSGVDQPDYSVLRRAATKLRDEMDQIEGTEKTTIYADPGEEIVVEIDRERSNSLNLSTNDVAKSVLENDTKFPAGRIQGRRSTLALEVAGNLDSMSHMYRIPIRVDDTGSIVELSDIATIARETPDPPASKSLIHGTPAIVLGSQLKDSYRIDQWRAAAERVIKSFGQQLPSNMSLEIVFDQYPYVHDRFKSLEQNFLVGLISVILCTAIWMNWRSAFVIGTMLPINCLVAIALMFAFNIPLHQMSVSGLVIAMGMLVDNAIVVVDHVDQQVAQGKSIVAALLETPQHLAVPLLSATLTTVFSFAPIALMPGATGEFVGSIATVTILTVSLSYVLALTVIPGISAMVMRPTASKYNWLTNPFRISENAYRILLRILLRFPALGATVTAMSAVVGFASIFVLNSQFFPPADRDMFHIECELPISATIHETESLAQQIRQIAMQENEVEEVHWFLGGSAPVFYYNLAELRSNQPNYAQAIVKCHSINAAKAAMKRLQPILQDRFPQANLFVRQLEQGPPFTAPVEIRVKGPDLEQLRFLAGKLRRELNATPGITNTRCEIEELSTKGVVHVDSKSSFLAGYPLAPIVSSLQSSLDGILSGTILDGTEEIPVRVRMSGNQRGDLSQVTAMELQSNRERESYRHQGIPLSGISELSLFTEVGSITRVNKIRCAEVHGFIPAGMLPSLVVQRFKQRLSESGFELTPGYTIQFLGEAGEQQQALGNLFVFASILSSALIATLVLSLNSFRMAMLVASVSLLSVGYSLGSLALLKLPFGFMAIIGVVGMLGVAVNDSILIVTSLSADPAASTGNKHRVIEILVENSRHVLVTSITTIAGFLPLVLSGGDFWPPTAVAVSMGVAGSTLLALLFVPCAYLVLRRMPSVAFLN